MNAAPDAAHAAQPNADEARRTMGPIVVALADAVSPPGGGPSAGGYEERLGIKQGVPDDPEDEADRERRIRRLLGPQAAVYLAGEAFGCPGIETRDFEPDQGGGIASIAVSTALDSMGSLDGVGGMGWDEGGRFARFLSERGRDLKWLNAAAAIVLLAARMDGYAGPPSRNDLLEEVHFRCTKFTRAYLSQVCGDVASAIPAVGLPGPISRGPGAPAPPRPGRP